MTDPGGLAAGITILMLMAMGILAALLTRDSRNQQTKRADRAEEEAALRTLPKKIPSKPPQLPVLKTRSSLSMSTSPVAASPRTPITPKSPGIRFNIITPSYRSRKSGSIDSLPNTETVLERYEQGADAVEWHDEFAKVRLLGDGGLGEPGPSIPYEEPQEEGSVSDRPHLGLLREASESQKAFKSKH